MNTFSWFRREWAHRKVTVADHGLLTAAELRSVEQVIDELGAELQRTSPNDLRWWELSKKIKILRCWNGRNIIP